jgi:uncharacterized protein YgbK (DUF1537 family)
MVESELAKMHEHLLRPMGVGRVPGSVREAVAAYTVARKGAEERLATVVPRVVEEEVRRLLSAGGYAI